MVSKSTIAYCISIGISVFISLSICICVCVCIYTMFIMMKEAEIQTERTESWSKDFNTVEEKKTITKKNILEQNRK